MAKSKSVSIVDDVVDTKAVAKRVEPLEKTALSLKITSAATYEKAVLIRKDIRAMQSEVKNTFEPIVKSTKAAYDEARAQRDKFLKPLDAADSYLKKIAVDYEVKKEQAQQAKIETAIESGNEQKAAKIMAKPAAPIVEGVSYRDNWAGECTDFLALVKAVASGKVPTDALILNTPWLNAQARAEKSALKIPGCKAVNNRTQVMR